ncbi:MAG: bifunctional diaminohydroxyphosphoribosylaminopyrimidine deaminase/5-amino-6-(5-phosphoribosylamino)uracil reductase RibD [Armatimonadetes bacterium]|nr:bifunctional diaminohydroxyphosphoribosylaminopyrimidine deaminase/5-amino-6-(5-phosphoribosylamino)uracil reductase RibD [Armatimonadota bacterium]
MGENSERLMRRAVEISRHGFPAPNPHVGCVIAVGAEVVGEGFHDHAGGPHAEAVALKRAGKRAQGADLYCTLEPCDHHGRTPPCSHAIVEAGVRRAFVAVEDPNADAAGGLDRLREAGVECNVGLLAAEAEDANLTFLTAMRRRRPYVVAKAAVTADGFIAREDGGSKWITGEPAREAGRRLRAEMGCVLVGRRTAEIDDPELTVRVPGIVNQPLRVVLDPRAALSSGLKLFSDGGETVRVVRDGAAQRGGDLEVACDDDGLDLDAALRALFLRGVVGVLVEGGGETIASFLRAGLVDEVHLFRSPKEFGKGRYWLGESPPLVKLNEVRRTKLDVDEYVVCEIVERAVEQSP